MSNSPDRRYGYSKRLVLAGGLFALPFLTTITPVAGLESGDRQLPTRVPTYTPTPTRTPNVIATEVASLKSELAASKSEILQIKAAATLQANAVATAVSGNAIVEYRLRKLEMFDRMALILSGTLATVTAGYLLFKKFGGHGGGHGH